MSKYYRRRSDDVRRIGGLCWTAVVSRFRLITSTFALQQFLEQELFEYFKIPSHESTRVRFIFSDEQFSMIRNLKISNRRHVTMSKYYDAQPREEALQDTLLVNIIRRSDNVRPIGGAVLDSCFVQIRTHQQHFCPLPDFRAGAL